MQLYVSCMHSIPSLLQSYPSVLLCNLCRLVSYAYIECILFYERLLIAGGGSHSTSVKICTFKSMVNQERDIIRRERGMNGEGESGCWGFFLA